MANPATTDDIVRRWRPLSEPETNVAQALLDDAWVILSSRIPTLDATTADGTTDPNLVRAVLSAMVLRVMRNPEGKRQESIDDYSWTRDQAVSTGTLYVSDDELALLRPAGSSSGAFSIRPVGSTDSTPPDPWITTTEQGSL